MTSGIYCITNIANGKRYVGSSVDIERRWRRHQSELRLEKHHCVPLQRAWRKYGGEAFIFTLLEHCTTDILAREQFYLDTLRPEYNVALCAEAPMRNRRMSELARANISAGLIGRHLSAETRAKIAKANTGNKNSLGIKRSESERARLRGNKHGLGYRLTPQQLAKKIFAQTGKRRGTYRVNRELASSAGKKAATARWARRAAKDLQYGATDVGE